MAEKILVVDDDLETLRLVGLMLQRQGYEIIAASNGAEGIQAAKTTLPDVILLDVMMPDMDGGELAACFQANPKLKAVPIVFLTAAVTKGEVKAGGGQVGGQSFLAKPVVLTEVVASLKHHLGG